MTTNSGISRSAQAEEHELRTLQIVDLAAATVTEAFAEKHWDGAIRDLIDELLDEDGHQHPSLQPVVEVMQRPCELEHFTEQDHLADNAHALFRRQLLGLAIQFGSTVRKYMGQDTFASGFGYMRTVWIYADTYEAAWDLAVQWAEKSHAQDAARDAK